MRTNENEVKSPENGNQPIKSHKNITSTTAFHLKSENDRGQQEHHRSPDAFRGELRDTWRRSRMPYNKLPQVFNQQKQKKKYGGKVREDMIQNLDKLVENSQYKETQKYLQPLKPKQEKKQSKKEMTESRNLFNPIQKMRKMVDKAMEEIKQTHEMSVKSGPKISECITLDVIKRGHNTGIIKKMLHVPTLTLVCVRQEPCTQKQSRNFIRDWTKLWREKLSNEGKSFVTIHEVLYNYPEGAISIFMQYFESRSLLNLLDLTTTLPQSVIREIFIQILKVLQTFYNMTDMHFGGLSPSQIMFTEQNQVKLSLGLFYHIPIQESYSIYHIKMSQKPNPFDFSSTITKFNMKNSIEKSPHLEIERSIDTFKLGLIALNCSIGNFENFEQSSYIFSAVRYAFSEQGQKKIQLDNVCCVLHSEAYLINLVTTSETQKTQKKPLENYISFLRLLKGRFSTQFLNFLCQCLKLNHSKRPPLSELVNHPFFNSFKDNDDHTVKIELTDLLALRQSRNQQIYQSATLQKLDGFLALLRPVLQDCSKETLGQLLTNRRSRIYQIGNEVGLNSQKLGKKLEETILELVKSFK